jgi:hypothetical protein
MRSVPAPCATSFHEEQINMLRLGQGKAQSDTVHPNNPICFLKYLGLTPEGLEVFLNRMAWHAQ